MHIVMHCNALNADRNKTYSDIERLEEVCEIEILTNFNNNFHTIMGKLPDDLDVDIAVRFLRIVAINVHLFSLTVEIRLSSIHF